MPAPFERLVAISLAVAALAACARPEPPAGRIPAVTGEQWKVAREDFADLRPTAAVVTTRDTAEARARIGGLLTQLAVREGDAVRRGQLLGVVADERIGFATGALEAQADALRAEADKARRDLDRTRTLFERGVAPRVQLEQDQAAFTAADRRLQAALAERSASAEAARQGQLLSPADGRVLRAPVPAGSAVMAGQTVVVIAVGRPVIRIELPEAEAAGLKAGVHFKVRLSPTETREAELAQVYPEVSGGRVKADLTSAGLAADLIGRRVEVLAPLGTRRSVRVPSRFISTRFGIDYVQVRGEDGRFSETPVQLGAVAEGDIREVLSGLKEGDVLLAARP